MGADDTTLTRSRDALRLVWLRWAPGLGAAAVLFAMGVAGGAYLPRAWRLTTFAFCAFAIAALVGKREIRLSRLELAFIGGLAGLTVWTELSQVWSDTPGTSALEGERDVVYLAGIVLTLLIVERDTLRGLLGGALAGVSGACAAGLISYVFVGHALNPIEGNLLFEPLGYANGQGIYAAIGILLAIGLAFELESRGLRLACALTLVVLVPTLYFTHSRAAELGLALGLVTLLRFGHRVPRWVAIAGMAAAVGAVALVVTTSAAEHGVAEKLFGTNRPHYWRVAWREYQHNRVLGSGAGTFERYWLHYETIGSFARDAHSLYLETLAELGPVGLGLLLAALLTPLLALRGRRDPLLATAAGAYVAFLVHAGVDWDWELPAVTLAGLLCGAGMLVARRPAGAVELRSKTRLALLVPALALGLLALVRLQTGPPLPFGP